MHYIHRIVTKLTYGKFAIFIQCVICTLHTLQFFGVMLLSDVQKKNEIILANAKHDFQINDKLKLTRFNAESNVKLNFD